MQRFFVLAAATVAAVAMAGCKGDGRGPRGLKVSGAARLLAKGAGNGIGGFVTLASREGIEAGQRSSARVDLPPPPSPAGNAIVVTSTAIDNGPNDLDPDPDRVVVAGDVVLPEGATLHLSGFSLISTQGNIFIRGTVELEDFEGLELGARNRAIVIEEEGKIDGRSAEVFLAASRVYLRHMGMIDLTGADGEGGGTLDVRPFSAIEVSERAGVHFGPDTTVTVDGGPASADIAGPGGRVEIDYNLPGLRSHVGLDGTISARGGPGAGGGGGSVLVHWGGKAVVGGLIDASAAGQGRFFGTPGGEILFGAASGSGTFALIAPGLVSPEDPLEDVAQTLSGAGQHLILLGPGPKEAVPEAIADVRGGDPSPSNDGQRITALTFNGGIRWTGNALASGVAPDPDEAGGGAVHFLTFGRTSNIRFRGTASATGDKGGDGGVVGLFAADGSIDVEGTLDASGGSNGSGGDGGLVAVLVDVGDFVDLNMLGEGLDDNIGGSIRFRGSALARGGTGTTEGGNGGDVIMDADPKNGEESTNGGGHLLGGSLVDVSGTLPGTIGLRASDGSGDPASNEGFTVDGGAALVGDPGPVID